MMHTHTQYSGFTLIELILSLTILAVVASIVLTTATELGERTRYEETEKRGLLIQSVVAGTSPEPSRFAADLGRFPLVIDATAGCELLELYGEGIATNAALVYRTRSITLSKSHAHFQFGSTNDFGGTRNPLSPDGSADIALSLGSGWRGPYLTWRHATLTDNWGRPWQIATVDPVSSTWGWDTVEVGDDSGHMEIFGIRSLGRDGVDEAVDASAPAVYPDEIQSYVFSSNAFFSTLVVQVYTNAAVSPYEYPISSNCHVRVFLYQPICTQERAGVCELAAWRNGASENNLDCRIQLDGEATPTLFYGTNSADRINLYPFLHATAQWGTSATAWHEVRFDQIPAGVRRIWAYAYVPGQSTGYRSVVKTVALRPGCTHLLNLYLTETF